MGAKNKDIFAQTRGFITLFGKPHARNRITIQKIEQIVRAQDQINPWKVSWPGGGPAPSIGKLEVRCLPESREPKDAEGLFIVQITPPIPPQTTQLMAYHNYVSNLAKSMRDSFKGEAITGISAEVIVATHADFHETVLGVLGA